MIEAVEAKLDTLALCENARNKSTRQQHQTSLLNRFDPDCGDCAENRKRVQEIFELGQALAASPSPVAGSKLKENITRMLTLAEAMPTSDYQKGLVDAYTFTLNALNDFRAMENIPEFYEGDDA